MVLSCSVNESLLDEQSYCCRYDLSHDPDEGHGAHGQDRQALQDAQDVADDAQDGQDLGPQLQAAAAAAVLDAQKRHLSVLFLTDEKMCKIKQICKTVLLMYCLKCKVCGMACTACTALYVIVPVFSGGAYLHMYPISLTFIFSSLVNMITSLDLSFWA